ncbi:hypothetical protein LCGC14_0391610 [marine sediment metagenome]|uniref:Uncharacterized protein n=1 Tax=marine sediment metagenome TaxID=412755 RepID=A0A0F9SZN8_9ZZZZ
MADLDELRAAEEEARLVLVGAAFDYVGPLPRAVHESALDAYREAIERRVKVEEEAKRAGLIAAHPWMGGAMPLSNADVKLGPAPPGVDATASVDWPSMGTIGGPVGA